MMQPPFALVVCISSTALFDCSKSHGIWKRDGLAAYKKHQRSHIKVPLQPGVGFPLVQSLLKLNKAANKSLINVVLVSRNDAESGQRVIESINFHKLSVTRMSFTCGTDVTRYLSAWKCDLFLSTEERQVRRVLAGLNKAQFEGIAAGLVYHITPELVPVQPTLTE
jgi:5'-nucleotidase